MRNAAISIAEINNGFLATTASCDEGSLLGPPSNSVQFYPTVEALIADAGRFITEALEASKRRDEEQRRYASERSAGSGLASLPASAGEFADRY